MTELKFAEHQGILQDSETESESLIGDANANPENTAFDASRLFADPDMERLLPAPCCCFYGQRASDRDALRIQRTPC